MNIYWGISEDIGHRSRMENAYSLRIIPEENFFSAGVFDGHIDPQAARVAADTLTTFYRGLCSREPARPPSGRRPNRELLKEAYLAADQYITGRGVASGTVAATLFIEGSRFWAANVGDVRIIMGTDDGALVLTEDHNPLLEKEKKRIEALGGRVIVYDIPRVQGELAISRALGDAHLKPFVTAVPRIVEGCLGRENDYAIIACDGIWAALAPETVLEICRDSQCPRVSAQKILSEALNRGSTDNITVIVLHLKEFSRTISNPKLTIVSVDDC